jgi:hypothetical protein
MGDFRIGECRNGRTLNHWATGVMHSETIRDAQHLSVAKRETKARIVISSLCEAAFGFSDPLLLWLGEFSPLSTHSTTYDGYRYYSTDFARAP